MRLQRLDLLRYGHFTDRTLDFPKNPLDLQIVFGPNEAGKSTALCAVEDLLFGLPKQSPYNFLHDYSAMRIGAVLENNTSCLEIIRRKGVKETLLDINHTPLSGGENLLRPFLAGADRAFFQRMFSLDHLRLEAGGREILEAKDDIGQMLFSAGTGIAGLKDQLTQLSKEADELWAVKKAKHRKYYQAEEKFKTAKSELQQHMLAAHKWQALKQAFETAQATCEALEAEREKQSIEAKRLNRIRRVYRFLHHKTTLEQQIAAQGDFVRLPEDAAEVLEHAERRMAQAETRIETLTGQLETIHQELEALTYDGRLIAHAEDIQALHVRRIEVRREKSDLPKHQAELEFLENELRALTRELGWTETDSHALINRMPARAQISRARALIAQHGELISNVKNKTTALEEAAAKHAELQKHKALSGAISGAVKDVSNLAAAIKSVRAKGDISHRVLIAEQKLKDEQAHLGRLLAAMHPSVLNEQQITQIKTPASTLVQNHRDQLQDWERRSREIRQKIAALEQALKRDHKILLDTERDEPAITPQALESARTERDALWELIKLKYIDQAPLPESQQQNYTSVLSNPAIAFEPAIREADLLADRRFEHAEAAARLAEIARAITRQEDDLAQLHEQETALANEARQLDATWLSLWAGAPFEPLSPDDMLVWLDQRNDVLDAIERRALAESDLRIQRAQAREAKDTLIQALDSLRMKRPPTEPFPLENTNLAVILEKAQDLYHEYENQAQNLAQLDKALREATSDMEKHHRELARITEAQTQWQAQWSQALSALGIAPEADSNTVAAHLEIIEQARDKAVRVNELRQGIHKISCNVQDFEHTVETMIQKLAQDRSDLSADESVLELEKRLHEAQSTRDLQALKREEAQARQTEINQSKQALQEANEAVRHLKEAVGADSLEALKAAIQASDTVRHLQNELSATLKTIEQEGDGFPVEQLEQECLDVDIDQIAAREEAITHELNELRKQLNTAIEDRLQAKNDFEAIGGDDAAARAAATCQEALAEMQQRAERYVQVRTSALLLNWSIDRFRREKQAPLLKRASELFAVMTNGSFSDLRVDYDERDQAHLIGVKPDGKTVQVPGMSTGTADQLYLALRIASIENYLSNANALPFVADDLFINFDDERARAGLKVLQALAEKTQVLFFTHHQHLVDIARDTVGASLSVVAL